MNVAIPDYCTATPMAQTGAAWPTSIYYSIGVKIFASCTKGYTESGSGLPSATCSAGGSTASSGTWSYYQGSCIGKCLCQIFITHQPTVVYLEFFG